MEPKPYFETHGRGEPVLILHGWGGSSATWHDFTKLGHDRWQWIIPDFPGFGKTSEPDKAWTISDYTDWTIAFYNSLKVKPKFLLTHSFGGRIAAKWLSKEGQPFQKAVLAAAAGLLPPPSFKQKLGSKIAQAKKLIPQKLQEPARKFLYKALRIDDYPETEVMQGTFKNTVSEDLSSFFAQIKIPVRLVWGRGDTYTPLAQGKKLNELITNSELVIIDQARHGIHRQTPTELLQICDQFFSHE